MPIKVKGGSGLSAESIQDMLGTFFVDSASINFTYDDGNDTATLEVIAGGVDHGGLAGLGDDDHTQYFLVTGRNNENLTFTGTGGIRSTTDGNGSIGLPAANRFGAIYAQDNIYVGDFNTESSAGLNSNALTSGLAGLVLKTAGENFFDLYQKADSHIYMAWESTDNFVFQNDGDLGLLTGNLLFTSGNIGTELSGGRPAVIYGQDIVIGGDITVGDDCTVNGDMIFANPLQGGVGSPTAPTYTFTGDTDNGLYLPAANTPGITANGVAIANFSNASSRRLVQSPTNSESFLNFGAVSVDRVQLSSGGNQLEMFVNAGGQKFCFVGYDDTNVPAVALYGNIRMSSTYGSTGMDLWWQADQGGDIGRASQRPRDLLLGRNAIIGGYTQLTADADPGAQTNAIALGAKDSVAGTARTLHLRTEEAVAGAPAAADASLSVWINNVEYLLHLTAV